MTGFNKALKAFGIENCELAPINGGRINRTFLAETSAGKYVIQQMNPFVFPDPTTVMDKTVRLTEYLQSRGFLTVEYLRTSSGAPLYLAEDNTYYRAHKFIDGHSAAVGRDGLYSVGRAWGAFHLALAEFSQCEGLSDFHNTHKRYLDLESATKENLPDDCRALFEFATLRQEHYSLLTDLLERGEISLRTIHADTKTDNILFMDDRTPIVIDFDTLQTGTLLYDYGDALRSIFSKNGGVDITLFKDFTAGYLSKAGVMLSSKEKEHLCFSIWLITVECGMRYLTDYLSGCKYFSSRRGAMLKCSEYFALAKQIEENYDRLQSVCSELAK